LQLFAGARRRQRGAETRFQLFAVLPHALFALIVKLAEALFYVGFLQLAGLQLFDQLAHAVVTWTVSELGSHAVMLVLIAMLVLVVILVAVAFFVRVMILVCVVIPVFVFAVSVRTFTWRRTRRTHRVCRSDHQDHDERERA